MGVEKMSVSEIPHGIRLEPVVNLIERYIPSHIETSGLVSRGLGMDFGSGWGRSVEAWQRLGLTSMGLEINQDAVIAMRKVTDFADVADVRYYGQGLGYRAITYLENIEVCTMIGLLENLPTDWRQAIGTALMSTVPGGYLVIAGVASPEYENPILRAELGDENYLKYKTSWQRRMAVNHNLKYEKNVFAVAKLGENKNVEWGDEEQVRQLIESEKFERFARHMDLHELEYVLGQHGFLPLVCAFDVWGSRLIADKTKSPETRYLSGYILVAKKTSHYMIHPWYRGMTTDQANQYRQSGAKHYEQAGYPDEQGEMLRRIRENIKPYNIVLSEEFIRCLNGTNFSG